jgi:hypothetical protein
VDCGCPARDGRAGARGAAGGAEAGEEGAEGAGHDGGAGGARGAGETQVTLVVPVFWRPRFAFLVDTLRRAVQVRPPPFVLIGHAASFTPY